MRQRVLIALLLLLPMASFAQNGRQRHRCWDIDLQVYAAHDRPDYVARLTRAEADTGALVVRTASRFVGTPYRYAGRSPKAFDCAGFVLYVYKHFGYSLPGWCGAQARMGIEVSDTRNLQAGDLVFFGGRNHRKVIGHVGIVVEADPEDGTFSFIHASTSAGVIISRSTEPYYKERYITARRILL